ncbi:MULTISPECIES: TIGR03668 family PPOX class F420-dependent oxidoreductase [unclassified Streptomyces]|uniref:TIGR03668 family PPOX class F420-dependent oxidoreductase n=1 Tax=unclassified Streptomyces TaxID=2593676 RepID=UPI0024B692F3|nr:TIGR03668 family PPOX class F420-dependent oxidoreductase [Streptomyces sp. KAU_LT]MDI9829763.1 TIGR03668 family PPOX class F420-dependent oxidoreductase [Streptomyces sp. KAU_LT]
MPDMEQDEARERFAAERVARLATIAPSGRPHLVPVVFAVRGDDVVTAVDQKPKRTPRPARLHDIAVHPAVCLLADRYDDDWERLWWVRADGGARVLEPGAPGEEARAERETAVELLRGKYPQYVDRAPEGPVIVVSVLHWTGWKYGSAS